MHRPLLFTLFAFLGCGLFAQRVGIVLSGGGASGMAHIGVLKALEENDIPIDYITGSSIGALVGGMYAAGYSPFQIDSLFRTDLYELMADGGLEERYVYYFKKDPPDASLITLRFDVDTTLQTSLPTNLRSPLLLDFEQMRGFAGATAVSGGNLDSLFVPFRSIASDITAQRMVVFDHGDLAQTIRASMSYPFYFKPISVGGHLMMDGGLYNNFPSDVMYDAFFPDIIIGSNVGYNSPPPSEDDLLSQIRAMLQRPTDYSVICENGIIIQPVTTTSLFDFTTAATTIREGYEATMARMPEIKASIARRAARKEVEKRRRSFRASWPALRFENIEVEGLTSRQTDFSKKLLRSGGDILNAEQLKSGYFRLAADNNIALLYPKATYVPERGNYDLTILAKRQKDLEVRFGGVFSSRAINTGMVGLRYNVFGRASTQIEGTGYFGKFYSAGQLKLRTDLSSRTPIFLEPMLVLHRWDYFRSFSTFFDEDRPSYVVTGEAYTGLNIGTALGNKGLMLLDLKYGQMKDQYYPDQSFSAQDTSDITEFYFVTGGFRLERNSLNRKQHPNSGELFKAELRFVAGDERTTPGSLSTNGHETLTARQEWLLAKVTLDKYFMQKGFFRLGFLAEGVYSTQPFFANYTETLIRNPAFQPTPESRTYFIDQFRAPQYIAGGMRTVFAVARNKFDVRIEGYVFQPYKAILKDEEGRPVEGKEWSDRSYLASGSLIYQSPLGPVWFNTSYIDGLTEPWVWSLNFGYVIFAPKAME